MSDYDEKDNLKFDLNRLWRTNNPKGDSLVLSAYNGNASFTVFRDRNSGESFVKIPISAAGRIALIRLLNDVHDSSEPVRKSFVTFKYDPDSKKMMNESTMVFSKNDERIFFVEISHTNLSSPIRFQFRTNGKFAIGSDMMTEAEKSELELAAFIDCLDKSLPMALVASKFNPPRNNNGGGYGSGNRIKFKDTGYSGRRSSSYNDTEF